MFSAASIYVFSCLLILFFLCSGVHLFGLLIFSHPISGSDLAGVLFLPGYCLAGFAWGWGSIQGDAQGAAFLFPNLSSAELQPWWAVAPEQSPGGAVLTASLVAIVIAGGLLGRLVWMGPEGWLAPWG